MTVGGNGSELQRRNTGFTWLRMTPEPVMGPLAGLSILELGDGTSAPLAAKLFGDFGADVVKIEPPAGDSSRRRGPFPDGEPDPEASGLFTYLNVNKLGVVVDLSGEKGCADVAHLLSKADVFITNWPAEALSAAGLAAGELRTRHPRLIVTTISPFGTTGPGARRRGDELVTFAMSGMAYGTPGMPDASESLESERPLHPACFVAETLAGAAAAFATMTALSSRSRTNEGCHVDLSQQAAMASMQIRDATTASYTGEPYNRLLNAMTIGRMPNFYLPCKDGYATVAAPLDEHWARLVEAMGKPEWAVSDDYATGAARIANWVTLREKLIEWTTTLTGDELHAIGERAQLPIFPFYPVSKLVDSEHVRKRGSLVDVSIGGRPARMPGAPIGMHATPWQMRRPAPRLGEHSETVLRPTMGRAS